MHKNILLSLIISLELHILLVLCFFEKPSEKYTTATRPEFIQASLQLFYEKKHRQDSSISASSPKVATNQNISPATERKIVITPDSQISGYLKSSELDTGPKPVSEIVIPIPENASEEVHGQVVLELYINAFGKVEKVVEVSKNVPDAFAKSAIDIFFNAQFVPGTKNGRNHPAIMKIQVDFLED